MELPSFEEFLSSLSEEDYASFSGRDNLFMFQVKTPLSDEDLSALIQQLASSIAASSGRFSIKLLKRYHQWLSQRLADS